MLGYIAPSSINNYEEEMYKPKRYNEGNELFHKLMDKISNFEFWIFKFDQKRAQDNIHLHKAFITTWKKNKN